jgi:uncharacterized protein (DUF952 family)
VRLRVATCRPLPKDDPDAEPLAAGSAAGVEARWVAWDDPGVDWDAPEPTILRSTWNYARDRDAFLAWAARASRASPLWNPLDVLRANTHKRYLLELAARGVPVVPTVLVERGEAPRVRSRGWTRVVVKPAVGAGSLGARAFDGADPAAEAHAEGLAARGEVLIQPYLDSVHGYGERSLVWIDGELSHAVRKAPRFAGDGEQVTGPLPIADDERELALSALAGTTDRILYGRVDVARDAAGVARLMELELTEPSLYFAFGPGSAERYVRGLVERLRASARLIYKICPRAEWHAAVARGVYEGSAVDRKDGFIHFSSEAQVGETLRRHFAGQRDLLLIAVDPSALGTALRLEPSRGGALFPHLYGDLPTSLACDVREITAPAAT